MEKLNANSTCEDVIKACGTKLDGSSVIVTGANTGIGLETARQLSSAGATVIMACRSLEKAEAARESVLGSKNRGKMMCMTMDLSDLSSIESFVQSFLKKSKSLPPLKALVCNAGVFLSEPAVSKQNFELTFATNHLGHFFLTKLLLPTLRENCPSRVVVVGSDSHYGPLETKNMESKDEVFSKLVMPRKTLSVVEAAKVYGSSKLCNLLFTQKLHELENENGVHAACLHPGTLIPTDITRDTNFAVRFFHKYILSFFTKSLSQGASTTLFCCLCDIGLLEGKYFDANQEKKPSRLATKEARDVLWTVSEELIKEYRAKL